MTEPARLVGRSVLVRRPLPVEVGLDAVGRRTQQVAWDRQLSRRARGARVAAESLRAAPLAWRRPRRPAARLRGSRRRRRRLPPRSLARWPSRGARRSPSRRDRLRVDCETSPPTRSDEQALPYRHRDRSPGAGVDGEDFFRSLRYSVTWPGSPNPVARHDLPMGSTEADTGR